MASLRDIVKDHRDELVDGIAWLAFYKDGRSWGAGVFWPVGGDYDNGFVFSQEDYESMKSISSVDPKAVCINGYYMPFGEDFVLEEIENKILYFYEFRLNQLIGDFMNGLVIPPDVQAEKSLKQFNISYMGNNIPQTILVEAGSSNEAGRYFMSQMPDAKFYGIHEVTADDMRPGKPVMTVPADFLKNNEVILKQYGLDNPSDETFHYRMLDRLRSDCEYYLGNGNRYAGHLWVNGDEKGHIELMKALWNSFPADGKPEWLPFGKILEYEKEMVGLLQEQSGFSEKNVASIIRDASVKADDANSSVSSKNAVQFEKE